MIELKDVSFTYTADSNRVLKTVSLYAEENSVTAILGPNGVGKTTLLHLLLGWIRPDSGAVLLGGELLSSYTRREMGLLVGLIPQYEHMSFEYSLLEYVLLGRTPHLKALQAPTEEDYEIALHALHVVGLGGIAEKPVTHLSGGEKQLVLTARTIAQNPRVLLMDEPMSNLDLANKVKLLSVMNELKDKGATILFTSHEPEIAASIADVVILMGAGNFMRSGTADEVLTSAALSRVYGIPVTVAEYEGSRILIWRR